ncbi:MAG: hypothetical protein AUI14_15905 [Actinobacteria bacterium 13_2_20CM_2_71_6]|nr:MAG: hypothetical protein AUI14_15905 [Actinobacteria bacterium 13_2_20CM_2_71_6]
MSYDPTGPYRPEPSYQPWQQPAEPQYGTPNPGPGYPPPPPPAYPTSGGGYPAPGYPQPGYAPAPPPPPKKGNTGLIITLVAVILVVLCGGGIAVTAILVNKNNKPAADRTTGAPGPTTNGPTGTGSTKDAGGLSSSGTIAFGADHGVEWNDKVSASVLAVVRFTPSKSAAGTHAGQVGIKVTVKITNNSSKQVDLTLARVKVKSGSNGTQADTIIDLENNLGLGFEGSVATAHSATANYAFSVPSGDLSKIDIEVSPDFDYDPGIFEGSVS